MGCRCQRLLIRPDEKIKNHARAFGTVRQFCSVYLMFITSVKHVSLLSQNGKQKFFLNKKHLQNI